MTEQPGERFVAMVRDAERVGVHPSKWAEEGRLFAIDPSISTGWMTPAQPVLVVCHPDDEETALLVVHHIRAPGEFDRAQKALAVLDATGGAA